jgi:hypothetical protein
MTRNPEYCDRNFLFWQRTKVVLLNEACTLVKPPLFRASPCGYRLLTWCVIVLNKHIDKMVERFGWMDGWMDGLGVEKKKSEMDRLCLGPMS